jgi:hypothetical protein
MKLLSTYRATVPAVATQDTARADTRAEAPATAKATPSRRPRLPRDSHISFSTNPAELYVSLTMTKIEHLEALMETLQTYAPQLEAARRREDD